MDFVRKTYSIFVLEVLPIVLYREVKPLSIWFQTPLLDYDVSLHDLVELVVIFETSPSSSKTDSKCLSYYVFDVGEVIGSS